MEIQQIPNTTGKNPYNITCKINDLSYSDDEVRYTSTTMTSEGRLEIIMEKKSQKEEDVWDIGFTVRGSYTILLNSPNVFRTLSTVLLAVSKFIKLYQKLHKQKPRILTITTMNKTNPSKDNDDDKRMKVYLRMAERFSSSEGYRVKSEVNKSKNYTVVELHRK